jgi:hypothetical protein
MAAAQLRPPVLVAQTVVAMAMALAREVRKAAGVRAQATTATAAAGMMVEEAHPA